MGYTTWILYGIRIIRLGVQAYSENYITKTSENMNYSSTVVKQPLLLNNNSQNSISKINAMQDIEPSMCILKIQYFDKRKYNYIYSVN